MAVRPGKIGSKARRIHRVTKRYKKYGKALSHGRKPKLGLWGDIRLARTPLKLRKLKGGKKKRGRSSSSRSSAPGRKQQAARVNFQSRTGARAVGQLRKGASAPRGGGLGRLGSVRSVATRHARFALKIARRF